MVLACNRAQIQLKSRAKALQINEPQSKSIWATHSALTQWHLFPHHFRSMANVRICKLMDKSWPGTKLLQYHLSQDVWLNCKFLLPKRIVLITNQWPKVPMNRTPFINLYWTKNILKTLVWMHQLQIKTFQWKLNVMMELTTLQIKKQSCQYLPEAKTVLPRQTHQKLKQLTFWLMILVKKVQIL